MSDLSSAILGFLSPVSHTGSGPLYISDLSSAVLGFLSPVSHTGSPWDEPHLHNSFTPVKNNNKSLNRKSKARSSFLDTTQSQSANASKSKHSSIFTCIIYFVDQLGYLRTNLTFSYSRSNCKPEFLYRSATSVPFSCTATLIHT